MHRCRGIEQSRYIFLVRNHVTCSEFIYSPSIRSEQKYDKKNRRREREREREREKRVEKGTDVFEINSSMLDLGPDRSSFFQACHLRLRHDKWQETARASSSFQRACIFVPGADYLPENHKFIPFSFHSAVSYPPHLLVLWSTGIDPAYRDIIWSAARACQDRDVSIARDQLRASRTRARGGPPSPLSVYAIKLIDVGLTRRYRLVSVDRSRSIGYKWPSFATRVS